MRKRHWIILILLIIIGVILVKAGQFMLTTALTPPKGYDEPAVYQSVAHNNPYMESWMDSIRSTGALRDTFVLNRHGERQHLYWLPAREATSRTAFLIHGYTDNAISMFRLGYMYHHDMGYNIFLPDLRSHGLSEGDHIQMGWFDRIDCFRLLPLADSLFGGSTRMVVHGVSMGGATTMMLSGENTPDYVRAFVDDCGYTSAWDEFAGELHKRYHLPPFPVLYVSSVMCKVLHGWSFGECSALKQVAKCEKPMLFIHGDSDEYVPTAMVYPLYEAKTHGEKDLWLAPGSAHADSFIDHREEYTQRVTAFLAPFM